MGSTTEVILGFGGGIGQPVILLCKDDAPGKSPAIEQGNGFGRIVLRVDDATALSARLTAAGYTPDEMHADAGSKRKVFWATDPAGFRHEITQAPPSHKRKTPDHGSTNAVAGMVPRGLSRIAAATLYSGARAGRPTHP